MATNDKLVQAIKDVGDLRESIGATRAKLEALEAALVQRERELETLVEGVRSSPTAAAPSPRAARATPTAPPPPANSGPRARIEEPKTKLRTTGLAHRIVELLNASPNRTFTTAEMAREFNLAPRKLYGSLSRLTGDGHIKRLSDGVFRSVRGGAVAA